MKVLLFLLMLPFILALDCLSQEKAEKLHSMTPNGLLMDISQNFAGWNSK